MSGGLGFSKGKSQSSSSSFINEQQLPYLQDLWAGGKSMMQQQMGADRALTSNLLRKQPIGSSL